MNTRYYEREIPQAKHWHTITFSAHISEREVEMLKHFMYECMEECMNIDTASDLEITLNENHKE